MRTPLPPHLPDLRTAERLLDILDQLEQTLRSKNTATPMQLSALQLENAQLKARQAAAKVRLEALLQRIQAAATEPLPTESTAA